MIGHTNATNPLHTASVTFGRAVAVALPVILFAAVLLLAILVSLRYAHGWAEVVSEAAAATTPMVGPQLIPNWRNNALTSTGMRPVRTPRKGVA